MKVALIGIGQAGGKITQEIAAFDRRMGFDAVRGVLAANTARADLAPLAIDTMLVGADRLNGQGAGGDSEAAVAAMRDDASEVTGTISELVSAEVEAVFLVAALGGGTGSGGAAVLAERLGRVYDLPIYCLGILPGEDEAAMYHVNAGRALKTLVREADSVLLIDNAAWQSSDESLGEAYGAINEEIARRVGLLFAAGEATEGVGQAVVDSSEVINTLRVGGISALGYASAVASDDSAENVSTITGLARSALLTGMSLPGTTVADAALLVVAGRPKVISRKGLERARSWIGEEVGTDEVRGGDFPLDDEKLAALVLLGGIGRASQVDDIMARARQAQQQVKRQNHAEALRSDELDDVF